MKKLEVSKILVLMGISIGLVACGQVQSDMSGADKNSDSYSLKSQGATSAPVSKDEGGHGIIVDDGADVAAPVSKDEGGHGIIVDDGADVAAPVSKDEGGHGIIVNDGADVAAPVSKDEGGHGLRAELVDTIFYVKGSVDKEIRTIGLIINGKEQYTVDVRDGFFEFKVELAKEDFESMSVHLVIGKEVKTFMVLKGELQEVKY
ncbi:MAG: hypothetical protein R2877_08105 [Bdellovibrionota bacterium]